MRLSELYDELDYVLKDLKTKIKILNFEGKTLNTTTAAFNGIENTINILTLNGKYNIKIDEILIDHNSKTITLNRNKEIIEIKIIQDDINIKIEVTYK